MSTGQVVAGAEREQRRGAGSSGEAEQISARRFDGHAGPCLFYRKTRGKAGVDLFGAQDLSADHLGKLREHVAALLSGDVHIPPQRCDFGL